MICRRNLIWLAPLTLIITFPLWRPAVTAFLKPPSAQPTTQPAQSALAHNFVLDQIRVITSENSTNQSEITAQQAATLAPDQLELTMVTATIPNGRKQHLRITARQGLYLQTSRLLTLSDQAKIVNQSEGYELTSDLLHYDALKQTLVSPGPIHFQAPGLELQGSSLSYDLASGRYEVSGRVYCTITRSNITK